MVQGTEGTLGLSWEVLRAGEVQEIMGRAEPPCQGA